MEAKEIIQHLRGGVDLRGGTDIKCSSLRMAVVFFLRKQGYERKHIACALDLKGNAVDYYYSRGMDFIDTKDKFMAEAMEELEQHSLSLVPRYERRFGKYNIKTHLEVDNIKL